MTETTVTTTSGTRSSATWPLALVVAVAIGAAGLLVVVALAFSTHNTQASVHGTTATTSHWVSGK
ncbi:MAG: hypothetical protein JF603_10740 [Acidobacteria bacterium]|nr:hypothetical protein [Acidobacteriota bacterium]